MLTAETDGHGCCTDHQAGDNAVECAARSVWLLLSCRGGMPSYVWLLMCCGPDQLLALWQLRLIGAKLLCTLICCM